MTSAVQSLPVRSSALLGNGRRGVEVALLPTLPIHAGASMSLYTSDLLRALEGTSGVMARVHWPPFGFASAAGRFESRWVRYVDYVRFCRKVPGDVFHITDHGNAQLLVALPGAKTVVTCHDLYPVAVASGRVRFAGVEGRLKMTPTVLRLCLMRKAAAILAISEHTLGECLQYFGIPKNRLFLAYYGIADVFRSGNNEAPVTFRHRYRIPPEHIAVLHVGSNDPRKNVETVFRVVAALRENYGKNASLVKVGSGFGPREVNAIQRWGLEEFVHDLGPLTAEQTAQVCRACDVLLYPSFHEGFCRPVAEAMASGLPVVASNRGAIPEVAQDTQRLFHPQDVVGMASAIHEIAESTDLREELAQRGKLAARKFTWEAHGAAVAEAYQAVTGRWV